MFYPAIKTIAPSWQPLRSSLNTTGDFDSFEKIAEFAFSHIPKSGELFPLRVLYRLGASQPRLDSRDIRAITSSPLHLSLVIHSYRHQTQQAP